MRDARFALMVTVPVALFLLSWVVYPIGYSFWLSLNSYKLHEGQVVPIFAGANNYIQALTDPDVQHSFIRTVQLDIESAFTTLGNGILFFLMIWHRRRTSALVSSATP